jgi:hypothetical protein
MRFNVPIAAGDILIMATDGLYDNVYENQLEDLVSVLGICYSRGFWDVLFVRYRVREPARGPGECPGGFMCRGVWRFVLYTRVRLEDLVSV